MTVMVFFPVESRVDDIESINKIQGEKQNRNKKETINTKTSSPGKNRTVTNILKAIGGIETLLRPDEQMAQL